MYQRKRPLRTLFKLFFGFVLTLILCIFLTVGYVIFWVGSEVKENGLKSVVEKVWEGDQNEL